MAIDAKLTYDVSKIPQPLTRDDQYAIAILVETRATRIATGELTRAVVEQTQAINALLAQLSAPIKGKAK